MRCPWCGGDRFTETVNDKTGEVDLVCNWCQHAGSEGDPRQKAAEKLKEDCVCGKKQYIGVGS